MDTTNQNMPTMGSMTPQKKSHGALIAVIVILFLIVIGGLYFLGQRMSDSSYKMSDTNGADSTTEQIKSQSSSDDVSSINADLKASNVDSLDQGAAAYEAEWQ